jgi:hypothetical protein
LEFGLEGNRILPPSGLIRGQKISLLLSKLTFSYEKVTDFDHLPIPYRCVAVDLITGNEVILKGGSLAKAMRSTMSIPTVFNPVAWGDSLLIDGGLLNNLPVDVVKEMGADIVIAIDAGHALKPRSELQSLLSILEQTVTIPATIRKEKNIQNIDIFIEPDLREFSRVDFSRKKIDRIIKQGEYAALEKLPDLIQLKEQYLMGREDEDNNYNALNLPIRVFGVHILGNTALPFKFIYDMIDIRPGEYFNIDTLETRIRKARQTGLFELIEYQLNRLDDQRIGLLIYVKEMGTPTIHRITIRGNEFYPFSFLYQKLGLQPGQEFNPDLLDQRISELYSLGYFETITYEIEPLEAGKINLVVVVNESAQNSLRVGLHYDETNKFVGSINVIKTNALLKGARFEGVLQLAGVTKLSTILYYPNNTQNISIYPYAQAVFQDLPTDIFDSDGKKIATYHNRSTSVAFGFGISFGKSLDTKVEYNTEYMNVTPSVALRDSTIFPSWIDELHTIRLGANLDKIDNVLRPYKGFLFKLNYEQGFTKISSALDYTRISLLVDFYHTFNKQHTIRLLAQYGYGNSKLPVYKFHYISGPEGFVGMELHEFGYYRTSFFRADYQFRFNKNLHAKAIYNISPNYGGDFYPIEKDAIQGYGLGIKYMTAFGPIELIYGLGDRFMQSDKNSMKSVYYLSMGYNL